MPTIWPCPEKIDCPCSDNPLGNFSSESPDPFTHFSRQFPINDPPLNGDPNVFVAVNCGASCTSPVSQFDADACALRLATQCEKPPPLVGNQALSCQADCPDGPPFTVNIAAGTYLAETQELADAIARSFCLDEAIASRHCDMPGPPPPPPPNPNTPCPHITGTSTTPINANEGDNITLSVSYTYASTAMLMFVWFKDGVATYSTPNSTLNINPVEQVDAGDYILGIYASGCFPVFSSPIQVNVTASCPPEAGSDAPDTLDIMHVKDWETYSLTTPDFQVLVSSVGFCNPTFFHFVTPSNGLDHPPGAYGLKYVSGYFSLISSGCSGLTPVPGLAHVYQLVDEQFNVDLPVGCNFQGLAHVFRPMAGDPPPSGPGMGSGATVCGTNAADVQAQLTAALSGKVCMSDPYPPDNTFLDFLHTNMGGLFSLYFDDNSTESPPIVASTLKFSVLQITGQIPQPRKLKIDNFGMVSGEFSNPAIGANWDGKIPTRTTYTSSVLQWNAPASGGFGGAQLEWINNHPTSANGFGWRISIYGAGPTLVWSGLKAIDDTSIGRYYKDASQTPIGPECLTCSDDSPVGWSPP